MIAGIRAAFLRCRNVRADRLDTPALFIQPKATSCNPSTKYAAVEGRPDSAEEDVASGTMYISSSDLELMDDGGEQVVSVVFPSVFIEPGSRVTEAIVEFDIDEVRPGQSDQDVTISIFGEASATPAKPTDANKDLSNRTPTTANVMWQPESSSAVHDPLYTPDLSEIVNEIIALPGWASGNSLNIMFGHTSGNGCRWVEAAAGRQSDGVMTPGLSYTVAPSGCGGGCSTVEGIASVTGRPDSSEEKVATGAIDLTSSDLELVHEGSDQQVVIIVFPGVDIPPGASIATADVIFDVDEVRPGQSDADCTIAVYGEANANPAAPTDAANDISNRVPTSAGVTWRPEPSASTHDDLVTPDISSVVQEIVGLPGWASGNNLAIMLGHVSGDGSRWAESARENNGIMTPALRWTTTSCDSLIDGGAFVTGREFSSEEKVSTGVIDLGSSDLELVYEGSGTVDNEQVVLIVFPDVQIPPGSPVMSASILFDIDEVRPGQSDADALISIFGELNSNPALPTDTDGDVTARTPTVANVMWRPEPSVAVHDELTTPDISLILNEIVSQSDWAAGNNLGIMMGATSGSGARWAESSRNNNDIDTPALFFTYATLGGGVPQATVETYSVTGRGDSSEEKVTTGAIDLTSSDLELVHEGSGADNEQVVLIVFPSVNVPADAVVSEAYILFDVDEVRPGQSDADCTINIYGEASATPAAPSDTAFDISSRVPTAHAVTWQPEPSVNAHDDLSTPNIASIVQEIVSLDGWAAGNSMGILLGHITGDGSRWAESSRENNGIQTPALTVSFYSSVGATTDIVLNVRDRGDDAEEDVATGTMYLTSSDLELMSDGGEQMVLVVFADCPIPNGAMISSANILFDVDEVRPGQSDAPLTASISGQVGDAALPIDAAFDISSRTPTSTTVMWQPEASVNTHDDLMTPDLSGVVTEIVAGADWEAGKSMGFLFGQMSGVGVRWVEASRENNGIATPALMVSYSGGR